MPGFFKNWVKASRLKISEDCDGKSFITQDPNDSSRGVLKQEYCNNPSLKYRNDSCCQGRVHILGGVLGHQRPLGASDEGVATSRSLVSVSEIG